MDPLLDITGVILAGGQSSRFGSNKALALLHGKPLVQHVRDTVSSVFNDCLLVTNTPGNYDFLNIPMIRDHYQDMGPMAGIHAALRHTGKSWIFVVGCDMPLVTPELVTFLCSCVHEDFEAVIPWLEKGAEPLCGLYHKSGLAKIEQYLQSGKTQVKEMLENLIVRKIKEQELLQAIDDLQVFYNINRKQDLDSFVQN